MAQKTFVDGDVLTASDINTYLMGEGGAWTSYTPQIDQGVSTNIAKTVSYSKYARHGRMITFNCSLAATASGTAGSVVTVTLPVAASSASAVCGAARVYDASITTSYPCIAVSADGTKAQFAATSDVGWGQTPNVALASGDTLQVAITYEAAT